MASPIVQAIKQIAEEKHLNYETVLETVESALAAAYRKDFGNKLQNIKIEFDPETGGMRAFDEKTVATEELYDEYLKKVEERAKLAEQGEDLSAKKETEDMREEREEYQKEGEEEKPRFSPKLNMPLSEAKKIKKGADVGEVISIELEIPASFGRVAAQTAKQVIMQKLREAERDVIYSEFKTKEHQIITATVQRFEGRVILFDLGGRVTGVMRPEDQVPGETYQPGARLKVYIVSVGVSPKGPEILVSRSHPELLKALFATEIPEIASGAVTIKAIAREPGARSKIAVYTAEQNVDPVGSCIGQRGVRIQTVINELGGEKIDIIEYDEDPLKFIANALAPAKILEINLDKERNVAVVKVASDQLSLVIGRGGQNVRLAAYLTGWKINIMEKKVTGEEEKKTEEIVQEETVVAEEAEKPKEEKTEEADRVNP